MRIPVDKMPEADRIMVGSNASLTTLRMNNYLVTELMERGLSAVDAQKVATQHFNRGTEDWIKEQEILHGLSRVAKRFFENQFEMETFEVGTDE